MKYHPCNSFDSRSVDVSYRMTRSTYNQTPLGVPLNQKRSRKNFRDNDMNIWDCKLFLASSHIARHIVMDQYKDNPSLLEEMLDGIKQPQKWRMQQKYSVGSSRDNRGSRVGHLHREWRGQWAFEFLFADAKDIRILLVVIDSEVVFIEDISNQWVISDDSN